MILGAVHIYTLGAGCEEGSAEWEGALTAPCPGASRSPGWQAVLTAS